MPKELVDFVTVVLNGVTLAACGRRPSPGWHVGGPVAAVKPDIIALCHGGPIAEPEDAQYILVHTTGVAGFFGASSMERLPTEVAITENMKRFKWIAARGGRELECRRPGGARHHEGGRLGAPQGRSPRPVPRGRKVPGQVGVRDREAALLGLRRPALPPAAQPDVRGHRRLVAVLRPHVPPLRDAVRDRLDLQERQRLPVHGGDPGRGRPRRRHPGVQLPTRPIVPRGPRVRRRRSGPTSARCCRSTGTTSRLVARPPRPRDAAQLRLPRGHARQGRTSSAWSSWPCSSRTRSTSTTATGRSTGCSTSPSCQRDAQPPGGHGEDPRQGRRGRSSAGCRTRPRTATGTRSSALWKMKEEAKGDPELAAAFAGRPAAEIIAALKASERGRRFIDERVVPYQKEFGWHAVWSHEFIFPTVREDMDAGHRAGPRLHRVGLRLSDGGRGPRRRHRRGRRGAPGGSRGRGAGEDAGGQRDQPQDGAADPGPPLLHRPGHQRARPARPHRIGKKLVRAGRPRRSPTTSSSSATTSCAYFIGDPAGIDARAIVEERQGQARGREHASGPGLDRHGHRQAARLPVPQPVGLPGEVLPPRRGESARSRARGSPGVVEGVARVVTTVDQFDERAGRRDPGLPDDQPGLGRQLFWRADSLPCSLWNDLFK